MAVNSKTDAQKRADRIAAFREELSILKNENVITLTGEQEKAVTNYHADLLSGLSDSFDIDQGTRSKQLSLGMRIASFLGAIALAASVFFLFYQFWGKLNTAMQIVILMAAPILTLIATFTIAQKEKTGYFSKLFGLLSFICFVLNISMLGQIFNITPTDNALIVWAAFALLIAYSLDVRLLLAAGIICFIAFMSSRTGTWHGGYWLYFGQRPENFIPVAVLLFFIPQWLRHQNVWGFDAIYRVFAMLTLFIPMLILSNWGYISYLDWDPDVIEGMYQILGFGLSAALIWYGIRRHWNHVINTANTFFVMFYIPSFSTGGGTMSPNTCSF